MCQNNTVAAFLAEVFNSECEEAGLTHVRLVEVGTCVKSCLRFRCVHAFNTVL